MTHFLMTVSTELCEFLWLYLFTFIAENNVLLMFASEQMLFYNEMFLFINWATL